MKFYRTLHEDIKLTQKIDLDEKISSSSDHFRAK